MHTICGIALLAALTGASVPTNHVNHVLNHLQSIAPLPAANSTTHFYTAAVQDHFLSSVAAPKSPHWRQRFYVDQSYWCGEGCPVFVYIGGEGPQSAPSSRLFMSTLAQQAGALTVALEHRFFGESYPTASMSNADLKYLSSDQALADLARFIQYLKSATSPDDASDPPLTLAASARNSKFVTFGGSYPGNLAAWFKLKYPSLTVGSVASSAPVFAEYNFEQYLQVVGAALANPGIGGSKGCYDQVAAAVTELNFKLESSQSVPPVLEPCSEMKTALDKYQYQSTIYGYFQETVQYNGETSAATVAQVCSAMTTQTDVLQALVAAVKLMAPTQTCTSSDFQKDMVQAQLANTTFSGLGCDLSCSSTRQWIYMSCNEFGFFQTASGSNHPFTAFKFGGIEQAGYGICRAAFNVSEDFRGPRSNSLGLLSNTQYGARALLGINITIPNGSMDPWHSLGIVNGSDRFASAERLSAWEDTVFIKDTAHCRDMYAPGTFEMLGHPDSEAIVWAHAKIRSDVMHYLS